MKAVLIIPLCIAALVAFVWGISHLSLDHKETFAPRSKDIDRKVYENTQSYVHGKTGDLANYFEEYSKAETQADKETIVALIKMNFSDFDESKIRNESLRKFLVDKRGY